MDSVPKAASDFLAQVVRIASWRGDLGPPTSLSLAGATAMAELLLKQPAIAAKPQADELLRLFGPTDNVQLEELRRQSLDIMLAGSIAFGMTGHPIRKLARPLIILATDLAPESLDFRARLFGNFPFQPPLPPFPDWKEPIDKFLGRNCFAGVMKAVLELGAWASNRPTSDAIGITSLSTSSACGGDSLQILGGPFGSVQPPDVRVFVPIIGGGCREAKVVAWNDNSIELELPADVGPGCVGFVRGKGAYLRPQRVTGELTTCIGAVAEVWTRGFSRLTLDLVSCPPCLLGGENRITTAGPPQIRSFECTPHVEPGGQPILSWNFSNANFAQIVPVNASASAAFPSPLPAIGSIMLPPVVGFGPVPGEYTLVATNQCGEARAVTGFLMSRTPRLSIERIEVVQAIQRPDNSVRLVAAHRTIVRVFVNSGITDGFNFGDGPGLADVEVTLVAENLDTGAITFCPRWGGAIYARPTPQSRDDLFRSWNHEVPLAACSGRVRFKAIARSVPFHPRAPRAQSPESTVDVAFIEVPVQQVMPFLINDPSSGEPTPTMTDFVASLEMMSYIVPIPWSRFLVNPPASVTLGPSESLKISKLNWVTLWWRVATTIFLFPSSPVSGLRVGIAPRDLLYRYPNGGTGLTRTGPITPTFVALSRSPRVWAHELAHAYGIDHVRNTDPADPTPDPPWYDPRLPLTISDPGLDIGARELFPSGTNELMSYAQRKWLSVEHWDIVLDRIPVV